MKKIVSILLVVLGIVLGVLGFTRLDDSSAGLSVGDVEITATDESSRTSAYVLLGVGAICLVAGVGLMVKS